MTTFLLVRHGETDAIGKLLAGREPGWRLNQTGKQQAERLAQLLSPCPIQAIYTSPLERTLETAQMIAAPHAVEPRIRQDLNESRFGGWEGKTFEELNQDPEWLRFNTARSTVRPPGGDLMIETQLRMTQEIERLRAAHEGAIVAVVSHSDPLRALLAHYLGAPLDLVSRFEIGLASITVVRFFENLPSVLCMNYTGELPL